MDNPKISIYELSSDDWGYNLLGSAIDRLIRDLEGEDVIEAHTDFQERRELANELMLEMFGQEPCLFYVRRKGLGKLNGEEIWELTVATDRDDVLLPRRLEKLRKTLGLRAAVQHNGYGGLKIISTRLLQTELSYADGYSLPCFLRLLPNYKYQINIPQAALTKIAKMPICGDHVPTEEQIKAWKVFLQIEKKIAQSRQFCVYLLGHNYGSATRTISFDIDVDLATVDGAEENSLDAEDFWQRVRRAKNEDIRLFETVPDRRNWRDSRQLGLIEGFDSQKCIIRVRLERELAEQMADGLYQLPSSGFLYFQAAGDIQQIRRKEIALDDLNQGRTQNPYLGNFLFDASQARGIKNTVQLQLDDLLLSSANPSQKAAVEMVLASEDLALIQGPPGTGKTTVIAEICYQVALRGGRTLIASQANLAVDNALSRLVHNPVIRAVRKGKAEKVGEEGQPFLEEKVINTWLNNTATYCENNLGQRLKDVKVLRELLILSQRFLEYLKLENVFQEEQSILETHKANLELSCANKTNEYQQVTEELIKIKSLKSAVDNLLNQVSLVDWQAPQLVNLWNSLLPYISTDIYVRDFCANLRIAVDLASEIGIIHTNVSLFGLATWLHNTATVNISEFKTALDYANHTATAMIEAESAAQTHRQNSQYFTELNSNYKRFLSVQQSLQQEIRKLQKRKSEISSAVISLDTWLLTASSTVFNSLTQSFKTRQKFIVELIELPVELLTLIQQYDYVDGENTFADCQLKFNDLIQQYSQWDTSCNLFREIKNLVVRGKNLLGNRIIRESDISEMSAIKEINPVISLFKLKQLAQNSLEKIEKPLGIWEQIIERIIVFALNYKSLETIIKILRPYSRHYSVAITLEFVNRQAKILLQRVKPIYSESILIEITNEVVKCINQNEYTWLKQLQAETEQTQQKLEKELSEQVSIADNCKQKILAIQESLRISHSESGFKLKRAIALLQELSQFSHLPDELQVTVTRMLGDSSNILAEIPHFTAKIHPIESRIKQLENVLYLIDNSALLSKIQSLLIDKISDIQSTQSKCKNKLTEYQKQLNQIIVKLQQNLDKLSAERIWWHSTWEAIPDKFKIAISANDSFSIEALCEVENHFNYWQQQLKNEETYLTRYQNFIQDWIQKLRQPSESDRNDLRRIYLNNANVVGITCVQAANRDFSDEFKYFDVVIIDEVSKCTPPELLIPALKGKKLVMVGDHKQLPPMLNTDTLEEVAQEIGSTREELEFLEESIFKLQFESAEQSIKQMLNIQYRMHPFIMGAINQFYDDKLGCGILEPDIKRAHNLAGKIIQEQHHIVWIKTPINPDYQEKREGTSFINTQEIDVIETLCHHFNDIWATKVATGEPKKEIAIITFYGAQLRKIDERLRSESFPSLQIRTGTVDRFQGMERPVVIVSMVRNNQVKDVGFAKKPERVNVAFSRAQELLIIVGCHELFTSQRGKVGNMYSQISHVIRHQGGLIDVSRICG
ncbi:AAA domain-containing protein [Nostoc sp. CMAA1605]|uniref:AAA domain-containing protein n=1 Tax=Nostoc sp. CMAA1605 TaxID=2055159 RepID=UPI001F199E56|nr:AAA domain-containing protein [Nostoc sp. CMAA1605]MCF4968784.1 DNA helicase [Nostoc sp. CMAA1605]